MFSGVGGFELALCRATEVLNEKRSDNNRPLQQDNTQRPEKQHSIKNKQFKWECVGFSEIDKYAIQVYKKQFRGHKNYGNARDIKPETIPDFDLLVGGVPCQSWSIAGKRKGFEDVRGTMWFETFKILKVKMPKYFLFENVKGLLSHDKGNSFIRLCEMMCDIGYVIDFTVLNSKYFDVPQNRERVFILGIRKDCIEPSEII